MSFLHPQLLWLLLLPAALLLAAFRPARRAAAPPHPRITRVELSADRVQPEPARASARPRVLWLSLALACAVAALARPQGRTIAEPAVVEARDVLVAVDVSRSMLADDVAPSRLERARLLVRTLADDLKGERLGLLPFAGTAFLQSPLSADYEIFETFLDELGPDMIPAGGSDFTALLHAADEAFGPAETASEPDAPSPADRFLLVLSDGEAQDESWKPVAEKLAKRGVRVLSLGLGTASGAMIPDGKGGLVKDERGAVVMSKLDASTLRELARLTDGAYRDASAWVDLPALLRDTVARGRASRQTVDTTPRREELFAWFLAPALLLLAASLAREFPVAPRARRIPLGKLAAAPALALFVSLGALANSLPAQPAATAAINEPPPDPLVELVGQLAAADTTSGDDLARLAELTATQGEAARAQPKPAKFPEGALRDALAAIDQGRALAPRSADWDALQKRIDALLAPPPEQQPQTKPDPQNSDKGDQKNQEQSQQNAGDSQSGDSSPQDQNQSKSDKPEKSDSGSGRPKSSDQQSGDQNSASPEEGSAGDKSSGSTPDKSDQHQPKPQSSALGDLSQPDKKPDEKSAASGAEGDKPEPPSADEPTQLAGGVSASGQDGDSGGNGAPPRFDPALAVPQQRLERVRDADSPARLYQLMQQAETAENPDAAPAAGVSPKRDW